MPALIDERWEYFQPDPEIAELFEEESKLQGFEGLNIGLREVKAAGNEGVGIRFGQDVRLLDKPLLKESQRSPCSGSENAKPIRCRNPECSVLFWSNRPKQRYCSVECRPFLGAPRQLADQSCAYCGKTFRPSHRGSAFCSRQCASKRSNSSKKTVCSTRKKINLELLEKMYLAGEPIKKICLECGATPGGCRKALKRLGVVLRRPGNHVRALVEKSCLGCGVLFLPKVGRVKYHSKKCARSHRGKVKDDQKQVAGT